jgi:hypothetical protein
VLVFGAFLLVSSFFGSSFCFSLYSSLLLSQGFLLVTLFLGSLFLGSFHQSLGFLGGVLGFLGGVLSDLSHHLDLILSLSSLNHSLIKKSLLLAFANDLPSNILPAHFKALAQLPPNNQNTHSIKSQNHSILEYVSVNHNHFFL